MFSIALWISTGLLSFHYGVSLTSIVREAKSILKSAHMCLYLKPLVPMSIQLLKWVHCNNWKCAQCMTHSSTCTPYIQFMFCNVPLWNKVWFSSFNHGPCSVWYYSTHCPNGYPIVKIWLKILAKILASNVIIVNHDTYWFPLSCFTQRFSNFIDWSYD